MYQNYKMLNKYKSRLIRLKNVCGVGFGYKYKNLQKTEQPALIVFVEKKLPPGDLRSVEMVPKKIAGMETDIIEIGKVQLLGVRQERQRPAQPGVSVGHRQISAGTFGAVVKDIETEEKLILSNNHVLANGTNGMDRKAKTGDPILQPGGCQKILK